MPCYKPLQAFRVKNGRDKTTGKWGITFKRTEGYTDKELSLPCGRCTGCRLERSRIWAIRCMHEAKQHDDNIFITLTYDDDHLPPNNSLIKKDLQKFFKRLRKKGKFRYYACGEYGDSNDRPHYHAIIFGKDFDDKKYHSSNNGNVLYKSETLNNIWGKGYCLIGNVTFDSCAYVARYIMKKTLGKDAEARYCKVDTSTGEIINVLTPEYTVMSRKPGIGKDFLEKYAQDIYQNGTDGVVVQRGGIKIKAPRYYDNQMEKEYGHEFIETIKAKRLAKAPKKYISLEQLATQEKVKLASIKTLTRSI